MILIKGNCAYYSCLLVGVLGKVYHTVLSIYSVAEGEGSKIVIPKNSVLICSKSTKQEAVSIIMLELATVFVVENI